MRVRREGDSEKKMREWVENETLGREGRVERGEGGRRTRGWGENELGEKEMAGREGMRERV